MQSQIFNPEMQMMNDELVRGIFGATSDEPCEERRATFFVLHF